MRTTSAQSSGWIISSAASPDHCAIAVSTKPGQIAIARTPSRVELGVLRARQRDHRRLRRAVHGEARCRRRACDRREVDDPASAPFEKRDRLAADEQQPAQIDAELQVDVLRLQRLDRAGDPDSGRVDEHVEAAVALRVLRDDPDAVVLLAHVGGHGVRARALPPPLRSSPAFARRASGRSPPRPACARSRARCPTSRR